MLVHWNEYDARVRADHRGDDQVDACASGAAQRDARSATRVARTDVLVPGGEGVAIESNDEVDHGAVTVSAPAQRFRVV